MTSAWDRLSGPAIAGIAIAYALLFGAAGLRLFRSASTRIPGGLLVTVAVCMTPLAVYGVERALGWWPATDPGSYTRFHPLINGSWVVMEIATVIVSAAALTRIKFPFLTAPAAYALWFLSMDATALLFGKRWTIHQECWISVIFGLLMITAGYLLDGARELDFAFWFYLFGVLTFSGGLTLMGSGGQFSKAMYCLVHLLMMVVAVILRRKVFLIFGGIGVFFYLASEAETYFRNSTRIHLLAYADRVLVHPGRHCLQAERGRAGVMAFSPDAGTRAKPVLAVSVAHSSRSGYWWGLRLDCLNRMPRPEAGTEANRSACIQRC